MTQFGNRAFRIRGYGGPEVSGIDNIEAPTPGPGQVVVAVKAAGSTNSTGRSAKAMCVRSFPATSSGFRHRR